MERYRKKELFKIITLLEEVNQALSKVNTICCPEVVDTLIQCQESALEVGNCLETLGEAGQAIVPFLEEYCENLYQMSQSLDDKISYKKLTKTIRKQLFQIEEKIRYELPEEKKEIIFLPYKACMWDSLESVWKAAAEDEGCDAYVIPIPYFDRNSDGSFGQMHYEGDQYPDYIPITSWEDYHIEERHPDVIYIHNPYDQCNFVTSIHPDFYSARIKAFTDKLVYIPYFVATNHRIGEHFCVLPGTFYADEVIVEDEEIKEFYIKKIREYEEKEHCKGAFGKLEKKFLALGSPKFDKVLSTRREDVTVPAEWEKLIFKEDGTRKKVVLYNTTMDSLLKKNTFIQKIQWVHKIFYENRDQITLLWRPHPLNMTTMQSMRPQKLEKYQKVVADYRAAGYGIYDDTADLHRAITLSDAYYGDWSSVVSLYEKTGKPIMIQNTEMVGGDYIMEETTTAEQ